MADVTLREITKDNLGPVLKLEVAPGQDGFVAPNVWSMAQAYVNDEAWPRAIYAGDEPVGFVMLSVEPEKPEYWIWRFMIGADHQGKGYGAAAIERVVEHVRTLPGATELKLSFVPKPGNPEPFYAKLGFERTGEVEDGEEVMRLGL